MTKAARREVSFRGGIIAISNRPFGHDPSSAALASRMAVLQHEPNDTMLIAFIKAQARKGVKDVPAKDCVRVFRHVVTVCRTGGFRLDLRHYFKAVEDYRCWKSGVCETDWRVLVESAIHEVAAEDLPPTPRTRAETKTVEYELVRKLNARRLPTDELSAEWRQRTGKAMDAYYRRKRELRLP